MKFAEKCSSCDGTGFEHEYAKNEFFKKQKVEPEKPCYSCKGSTLENRFTDNIVCPYCGYEEEDSWEAGNEAGDYQCNNCEKRFAYEAEITREFISRRVDCLNGGPHRFSKPWQPWSGKNIEVIRCQDCDHSERREIGKQEKSVQ